MKKRKFYVYEHWRPDKDICFYVGKGHGRRATVMHKRNSHHRSIQDKLATLGMCVEVRLVFEGLLEDEAFAAERERVAFWRTQGIKLANRTDGGEGATGRKRFGPDNPFYGKKHTPEVRKIVSDHQRTYPRSELHKARIGEANKRRVFTPEMRERYRQAQLGKKRSLESIEKTRIANTGKKRSPEFCERMRLHNVRLREERAAKRAAEAQEEVYLWPWDEEAK